MLIMLEDLNVKVVNADHWFFRGKFKLFHQLYTHSLSSCR